MKYQCTKCDVIRKSYGDFVKVSCSSIEGHELLKVASEKDIQEVNEGINKHSAEITLAEHAESIMSNYKFKTLLYDTKEILYYQDGVYNFGGEALIAIECEKKIPNCSRQKVGEVIDIIRRRTACKRQDFNNDISKLVLENGILNLKTFELEKHSPEFLTTIKLPIEYSIKLDYPKKFIQFLKDCLNPHDIITVVEEMANIFSTNQYNFEVSAMWVGEGANGKSQAMEIISGVFGENNCSHVSIHSMQNEIFATAQIYGKLVNKYGDISNKELNNLGSFKQLISGEIIQVQKKNQHPFDMRSFAKHFFSTNEMPNIKDNSDGVFRRINVTKWFVQFIPGVNRIEKIADKILKDEKNKIFNLLLENYKTLLRNGGLRYKQSISQVREIIQKESDKVREFIEECLIKDHDGFLSKDRLYQIYQQYCEDQHHEIYSKQKLGANLPTYGFKDQSKKLSGKTYRCWLGFSINKDSQWNKSHVKGLENWF